MWRTSLFTCVLTVLDMTFEEIVTRQKDIVEHIEDDKKCHAMEDEMIWDFIGALAYPVECKMENADIVGMARLLLETRKIPFNRWCA